MKTILLFFFCVGETLIYASLAAARTLLFFLPEYLNDMEVIWAEV